MSDLTVNITDGNLGLVAASGDQIMAHLGVCATGVPNSVGSFGDITAANTTLGPGTLTENVADTISRAGSCLAVPVTPSVAGSVGSTTHVGTGAGTVVGSAKPVYQILVKVTTGGTLTTAQFAYSVNGGAYSNPVVSGAGPWSYLVPGTLTTVIHAAATYVLNDVYTITTAGGITVSGTGPAGNLTQTSSPIDVYDVLVNIVTGGGLGAAVFTYSLDGGNSISPNILVPGSGAYVIPGAGVMLTFASTFVAADTYEFTTVTAGFGTSDVAAALTALGADARPWFCAHVAGQSTSAANAASMSATVDTTLAAFQVAFKYVMGIVECPQTEGDSAIISAFNSFASNRVMVTVTDILHSSSLNRGRTLRRNIGVAIATRLASTNPAQDPGWVGSPLGSLANVTKIFRDESKTPGLKDARFTVGTTRPTKAGFFCSTGNMMAQAGSDFSSVGNRRVMDVACTTAVGVFINDMNADLLANDDGTIYDPEATRLEGVVQAALEAKLLQPTPPDASAVNAQIDRTNNIISTENVRLTVNVRPKPKARTLTMTIGFSI